MKPQNGNAVFALVLAAGSSSRFGRTKQLEKVDGVPLVKRAVDTAAAVCGDRFALVTGHDWQSVRDAGLGKAGFLLRNENYADGLGTSLALGARAVRHAADAILVLLADQPLVRADHVRSLIDAWSGEGDEIVATTYDATAGPPVLFPRDCFDDLANLEGDSGGKHLFSDTRFRTTQIAFAPAAIDIDTPDDLEKLCT